MLGLKDIFIGIVRNYTDDIKLQAELWNDIEEQYSSRKRYYHNLTHLEQMYGYLSIYKIEINDFETILFSMFYHDIIYKVKRNDNEEKSADFAVERLKKINYPESKINRCKIQILATKHHKLNDENDTNLFTDADIGILGQDREIYIEYTKQIRKEYAFYPDILYKKGRRKVLEHFKNSKRIYKTDYFFDQFEEQSRSNVDWELELL